MNAAFGGQVASSAMNKYTRRVLSSLGAMVLVVGLGGVALAGTDGAATEEVPDVAAVEPVNEASSPASGMSSGLCVGVFQR